MCKCIIQIDLRLIYRCAFRSVFEGTFVSAALGALDTSRVPLNPAQRDAVLQLTGGLDIVVGPPGRILSMSPPLCVLISRVGSL